MFVKISKADAEQSIGFALTSAEEEYERIKSGVGEHIQQVLTDNGRTLSDEDQQAMARALTAARKNVENIQTLKAMIDFTREDGVLLDVDSFALLRPNLPAR